MKDDETVRQAKRTLERIGEEGGLSATPVMKSAANNVRDHFTAKDAEGGDKARSGEHGSPAGWRLSRLSGWCCGW
jgi:hypothetical protein